MFYSLTGTLTHLEPTLAVITCGGVGFKCFITAKTAGKLPSKGETAMLFTHLAVKEDALDLYGFAEPQELEMFKLLLGVSGVGAKMAVALLSEFDPDRLALLIASGDSKTITAAQGVGPKLAQRIVLELKNKVAAGAVTDDDAVASVAAVSGSHNTSDAVSALVSLGYTRSEAASAVSRQSPALSTDELIKGALKILANNFLG